MEKLLTQNIQSFHKLFFSLTISRQFLYINTHHLSHKVGTINVKGGHYSEKLSFVVPATLITRINLQLVNKKKLSQPSKMISGFWTRDSSKIFSRPCVFLNSFCKHSKFCTDLPEKIENARTRILYTLLEKFYFLQQEKSLSDN